MYKSFENTAVVTKNITEEIRSGNYNFFSVKSFFGFDNIVRLIKMINILLNFILILLIIISIIKKNRRKLSISFKLTGNILIMNFIHTLSYIFNWMIYMDEGIGVMDYEDNRIYKIGGLLVGNPRGHLGMCEFQAIMLIFSSLSQEFIINIFFYLINKTSVPSKQKINVILIILGYFAPFVISLLYFCTGGLGINNQYCYIRKYSYDPEKQEYSIFGGYTFFLIIIYVIRVTNLTISFLLMFKIIIYIRKNKLKRRYTLKTSFILIVQMINIIIGIIYRLSHHFSDNYEASTSVYLSLNTIDGILLPFSFSLFNGIYSDLFGCSKMSESTLSLSDDQEELNDKTMQSTINSSKKDEKTFAMMDIKDDNNFEISYF
jgi:hypothetical protein